MQAYISDEKNDLLTDQQHEVSHDAPVGLICKM